MTVQISRDISAPASVLWGYLADFANINRFHPLLNESHFTEGTQTCEVGSTRQCDFKDGNFLKERVVEWKEGAYYQVEVYETSMPMSSAFATLGVKPTGNNQSQAFMKLDFTPKYRLMGPMMYLYFKFYAGRKILEGLEGLYLQEHQTVVA